jgi:hypothetical protein
MSVSMSGMSGFVDNCEPDQSGIYPLGTTFGDYFVAYSSDFGGWIITGPAFDDWFLASDDEYNMPFGDYQDHGSGIYSDISLSLVVHTTRAGFNVENNGWEVLLDTTNKLFSTTNIPPGSTICCVTNINSVGETNICTFMGTITYP